MAGEPVLFFFSENCIHSLCFYLSGSVYKFLHFRVLFLLLRNTANSISHRHFVQSHSCVKCGVPNVIFSHSRQYRIVSVNF